MSLRPFCVLLLALAVGCSSSPPAPKPCASDSDCLPGDTCEDGFCPLVAALSGPASQAATTMRLSATTAPASGTHEVTVVVRVLDSAGQPVAGLPVQVAASGQGATLRAHNPDGHTNNRGELITYLSSSVAEAKTVTATVSTFTVTGHVTFTPWTLSQARSSLSVSSASLVADGAQTTRLQVAVVDVHGNPASGVPVRFSVSGSGNTLSAESGSTDAAGLFSATLSSRVAEAKTVTAQVNAAFALRSQVSFTAAALAQAQSSLALSRASLPADGAATTLVQFVARDALGNGVPGVSATVTVSGSGNVLSPAAQGTTNARGELMVALASTVAEQKTVSVAAGNASLSGTVTFTAGAPSAARSPLAVSPTAVPADGGSAATLAITVRDATGNPLPNRTVRFFASGWAPSYTLSPASAVTDAQGLAQATLRTRTVSSRSVSVQVVDAFWQRGTAVFTALPSALRSTLAASPTSVLADGRTASTLSLRVVDANGNALAGYPVALSTSAGQLSAASGTSDSNGLFSSRITSTTVGAATVSALVGPSGPSQFTLQAQVTFLPLLAAPTGLAAIGDDRQVLLSWQPSTDVAATSSRVYRNGVFVADVGASARYTDTAVTNGTAYSYQVTAYGASTGESQPTASVSATPQVRTSPAGASGASFWARADRGVTASGGLVSQWNDLSTTAAPAGIFGSQPSLATDAVTGKPVVRFSGGQGLRTANRTFIGTARYTVFVVTKPGSTQVQYADMIDYAHTGGVNFVYEQLSTNTNQYCPGGCAQLGAGQWQLMTADYTPGSSRVWRDGGNLSASAQTVSWGEPSPFVIGNWNSGGRGYSGDIAEVVLYPRVLTDAERQAVEQELRLRWSLQTASDTPSTPANVTAQAGSTLVTLGWSAVAHSELSGYRIYRDGTLVATAAATATSYVDGGLTNGTSYSYRVSAITTTGVESARSAALSATPAAPGGVASPVLWLRADRSVSASGGLVTQWADQSGNGVHAGIVTGMQPTFATDAVTGKPVVRFSGGQALRTASRTLLGTARFTFFAMVKPGSTQGLYADIFDYTHASGVNFVMQQAGGVTNQFCYAACQQLVAGRWQLLSSDYTPGTNDMWLDGAGQSTAGATVSWSEPTAVTVGNWSGNNRGLTGDIAEIVFYNRVLTQAERQAVEAEIRQRWQ